jgi:hypothetical protein
MPDREFGMTWMNRLPHPGMLLVTIFCIVIPAICGIALDNMRAL